MDRYELGDILLGRDVIRNKVKELAQELSLYYKDKPVHVIGVLKGSVIFLSDLIREMDAKVHMKLDFLSVSSYGASTKSSGVVKINKDLDESVVNKNLLIVEDIVDTGLTLQYLVNILKERSPKEIKICSLLDKPERRVVDLKADFCGFTIPDEFVVGYGLDYGGYWRNLPDIHVLRKVN
ncbi:hypoxanthine phosphoribosyltransferase [Thermovirga lienii DSM 17291]|jgi:hypoxanthine phosphoribosyltransferase|uniref:Hypoxanthine phosphoribosyltransferase n=1 Tax=Thermovirga lienii (strain ATCC BAA-1197 / DSM 17291 / Cas60314) TaxID=580340 RepID=G7V9X4_THELD|nr:hypoxanthine phosphoribosyltransferase [Thermovirga lienii]MDN5319134.1 hypoxanthine phosphoribosyltransferase [Thermovirga sp.]AER66674.1 hypoxanthine phosphoribosyltransferase [Thermovirga lienii DSM 17291]KUK42011.1 MAG: Hypoxanthine phosphoribosyltransferase [Thermovirga lienii]MDN5367891.1 hypoxanthine phosphoribosyltransferase [Thermovirga sp.]HCD71137.1 hypoxanthine phosphoribosyltransferase [Thermovirga lienii]